MIEVGGEPDAALVRRARFGEVDAFEALVHRHLPDLHDHVARVVADPASDLAVATFRLALRRLGSLADVEHFRTWLYGLAGELLGSQARTGQGRPPYGLTSEQRAVWRAAGQLPLRQIRTLDLMLRRGMSADEVARIVPGRPERHLRRALRRLDEVSDDGRRIFSELPRVPQPDPSTVISLVRAEWSLAPPPAPLASHHGVVVWGAAAASVVLSMLVPAAVGLFPLQRQASLAPAEYTAAPFTQAAGVSTPLPEEPLDGVLPPLPTYEEPEPEPEPSETPTAPEPSESPEPEPSPTESSEPEPDPTEPTETETCGVLDILPPCDPASPSPSPSPSPSDPGEATPSPTETKSGPGNR